MATLDLSVDHFRPCGCHRKKKEEGMKQNIKKRREEKMGDDGDDDEKATKNNSYYSPILPYRDVQKKEQYAAKFEGPLVQQINNSVETFQL